MKTNLKSLLIAAILVIVGLSAKAQFNPIRNLHFMQHDNNMVAYDCLSQNCFMLYWTKPLSSNDTIDGYEIYLHDSLFTYTTDTIIACWGDSTCHHPGFFEFTPIPFWITVRAIYNHDSLRSIATDSIDVTGIAIGIKEYNREIFNISPNPATNNLTIDVSATLNTPATIEITNIEGQVIKQQTTNTETTNINVSALAKGMYFVKVKTDKGVAVKKFIKE